MTAPLLENHPRCHSSDPERAQAYLGAVVVRPHQTSSQPVAHVLLMCGIGRRR